ncbi:MAG: immunoglobulin domain-containing protein, partial [Bacteroidales bacterium]|nr:immunoglobulin domain-containing protein [Bacteroidales bacterium]
MKKLHYFLSIVLTLLLLTGVQKQNFAQAKSFGGELIVKIGLAAKPNVDDITLQFIESGTEEFNGDYDAYKMFGSPANPYVYILVEDQGFQSETAVKAFPMLSKNKVIKLGVKTEIAGTQSYILNFEKLNTIDSQVQIYLKDISINDSVDLRANSSYTFQSTPFYNNERFELKFFVPVSFEAEVNPKGPVTICQEESVELTTEANAAYNYQWYKDDVVIEDATEASYLANESGIYYVEVTFGQNKAISNNVEVIVNILPFVFIEPDSDKEKFCQGDTVNLLAFGEGENLVYQWKKDNNIIEGATSTIITVKEAGIYLVKATNS